jgi:hypothetical protein
MNKKKPTQLVSAIFCNSVSKIESGQIDGKGVFTAILAWSYPTSIRTWHSILTAYGFPQKTTTITVSIARPRGKKKEVAKGDVRGVKHDMGNVLNMPLSYRFPRDGFYNVYFNVVGTKTTLSVPILVATQPWPKITEQEREFLTNNSSVPHAIRMNVHCSECSQPYMFEANVLPNDDMAKGVLPFPDSGVYDCGTCEHVLQLKDIQGQLLSSIKTAVVAAMRGGK